MTKKIYINPGHSNRDPGAVGHEVERDLNVKVSNFMREHLLANYEVEIRMNDGDVDSLSVIANDANEWGADLFVSNHFNAGGGDGFEALVYSEKTVPLGTIFAKHVEATGQNLRPYGAAPGVKLRPSLGVLKWTHMPAVLTESAFVDTLADIQDWNEDAELKKLGVAYAEAAAEFLELENKIQTSAPAPVPEASSPLSVRALCKGHTGEDVKALQILLNGRGYNCGTPDGIFGSKTSAAVISYQSDKHLTVDGIAGIVTLCSLLGLN